MKFKSSLVFIFCIYLLTRMFFIFTSPPFTDESIYIRWGQIMINHPELGWLSLIHHNRQPLGYWIFGIGSMVFQHPLFGARLMTLLINTPVFFFIGILLKKVVSKQGILIGLFLYSVLPGFIQMQSMALLDCLIVALASIGLWIVTARPHNKVFFYSLGLGIVLGTSLWIKSTGIPLIFLFLGFYGYSLYQTKKSFFGLVRELSIVIATALIILLPLLTHKSSKNLLSEPNLFVYSPQEILQSGFSIWPQNFFLGSASVIGYFSPAILILCIGLYFVPSKRKLLPFALWFCFPFFIVVLTSRYVLLRYFLIGAPGLIFLGTIGTEQLINKLKIPSLIWVGALALLGYTGFFLIYPQQFFQLFPTQSAEHSYGGTWTSGYGIQELISFIDARTPADKKLILVVSDSPGNPGDYVAARYYFMENVKILFTSPSDEKKFKELQPLTEKAPVHLLIRNSELLPAIRKYLIPIVESQIPNSEDRLGLYEIVFPSS